MANIQKQFDDFHECIKLERFGENAILREKRDIIRDRLKDKLPTMFEQHNEDCPEYYFRDQGSYEMGTGIKPLNGDYDIDQGLYLEVSTTAYPDPVVLKKRVYQALEGHTQEVLIRRSCVTVFYQREDEPVYHVDIAVYSDGEANLDRKSRLAKGKENSAEEHRVWEVSHPQELSETIYKRFEGADRAQFRRVVRYLKRWKDENFPEDGNAAPLGIGLTVAAYDGLTPDYSDVISKKPNDLAALRSLIQHLLGRFVQQWDENQQVYVTRLKVYLPVEPHNDLFEQMTNKQMQILREKVIRLRDALDFAADETDPVEACRALQQVFGSDFPVPTKEETAKQHPPAIASSSNSA